MHTLTLTSQSFHKPFHSSAVSCGACFLYIAESNQAYSYYSLVSERCQSKPDPNPHNPAHPPSPSLPVLPICYPFILSSPSHSSTTRVYFSASPHDAQRPTPHPHHTPWPPASCLPSSANSFSTVATLSCIVCALSVRDPTRMSVWMRTMPFSWSSVCAWPMSVMTSVHDPSYSRGEGV